MDNTNITTSENTYNELYKKMLENMDVGVYFVDTDRKITFWNKGASEISGFSYEEVVGKDCFDNILNHVDEDGNRLCVYGCPLQATIQDGKNREALVYLHHKDGHRVKIKVEPTPIYENGHIIGAVEVFHKIDENQIAKKVDVLEECSVEDLKMLALYDQLTGVPNRRYLDSFLSSKMNEYKMLGIDFGVLFIDIDNFRVFNNTYGHDLGDKVLQVVSNTFLNAVRKSDLVGRWGGEEFIIVLPMISKQELEKIAEKVRMLVEYSILRENGVEHHVTVSIGGSMVKASDEDEHSVVKRADENMYVSKQNGKNRVTIS